MYTLIIKQGKRIDGSIIDILIKDGKSKRQALN